ncbi:MAG: lytic transglycosylase domain-containing protein, partial [Candidatus Adiutrix sp.]|nr:lytic transglycosylase domain-containing protein [Candidatus Adiutrix sp.]
MKIALLCLAALLSAPAVWPASGEAQAAEDHDVKTLFEAPSQALGLPAALLMAVAEVESGLKPWSVNVSGRSFRFASREEALLKAREA